MSRFAFSSRFFSRRTGNGRREQSDSSTRRSGTSGGGTSFFRQRNSAQHGVPLVTPMRRLRVALMLALFGGWAALITGRLVWLQVVQHTMWTGRAERQEERTFKVEPRRGIIFDRNLHELAMTVVADSIYADPSEIGSLENKERDARLLAAIVHRDPEDWFTSEHQIFARLRDSRAFAWVARKQSNAIIAQVKALHLKGIYYQKEFKRFYPDQTLAAQVLGYVGMDGNGLAGVEETYNQQLRGTPGRMLTAVDARRHVLASHERDPEPGENLMLTLDANIQYMAEKALEWNMKRTGAEHGTVVVQDPYTGQILALAIRPTFNPNDFRYTDPSLLRDRAVSDVYEPGSVFKIVTYSAALNDGIATPDSMVDCLGGAINVAGRIVHDAPGEHYHVISVTQALEVSSDVGAIQMALRLGKDRFYHYIREFGFGQKTGISLPGETRGLVKPPDRWQPTTIGSIPMGQEIAVTPIQVATMVSTVANGGVYIPPHIVLRSTPDTEANHMLKPVGYHPAAELPSPLPRGARRVVTEMTAAEMRQMLEDVVLHGTGTNAQLDGYSSAGKTGTAQKIDPRTHRYSKTNYIASFAGFAPVNNPAVTIVVVMDSPHKGSHYGATASAPLFRMLAQEILEYLGVPHDQEMKPGNPALLLANAPVKDEVDDVPQEQMDDLQSLFSEVNHLPADDPLRNPSGSNGTAGDSAAAEDVSGGAGDSSGGTGDGQAARGGSAKQMSAGAVPGSRASTPETPQSTPPRPSTAELARKGAVEVPSHPVTVPSFEGKSLRQVVMEASAAGLGLRVVGSGMAAQQVPAAGTKVPAGTQVVVQFR